MEPFKRGGVAYWIGFYGILLVILSASVKRIGASRVRNFNFNFVLDTRLFVRSFVLSNTQWTPVNSKTWWTEDV